MHADRRESAFLGGSSRRSPLELLDQILEGCVGMKLEGPGGEAGHVGHREAEPFEVPLRRYARDGTRVARGAENYFAVRAPLDPEFIARTVPVQKRRHYAGQAPRKPSRSLVLAGGNDDPAKRPCV